jgi:hypothetical protein
MTLPRYVKEPQTKIPKKIIHCKRIMINYLIILEIWDAVDVGYVPKFDKITMKLRVESKLDKKENEYVVNIIIHSYYFAD